MFCRRMSGHNPVRPAVSMVLALLCGALAAQDPQPPPAVSQPPRPSGVVLGQRADSGPTGSVSGRLVLGDTQLPARFAQVVLIPVENVETDARPGGGFRGLGAGGQGHTDLDGQFTINGVAAGDYYVAGQVTGYISQTAILQARAAEGADAQALLNSLPVAHVSGGGQATVNMALTRGGTIAGRVVWDDGSPAAGIQVGSQMATAGTSSTAAVNQAGGRGIALNGFGFGGGSGGFTDDRGSFRLTGLAPGTYVIRVTVQAPMATPEGNGPANFSRVQSIVLYAPGKVRRADAQTFTIHEGEERPDVQMVLDLHSLHTVSGHVGATSGPEPQSGSVRLVDPTDGTLNRTAVIASDGSFTLTYVPSGSYMLGVSGASTNPAGGNGGGRGRGSQSSTPGTTFQLYSGSVTVTDTDLSGVAITLTPNGSE